MKHTLLTTVFLSLICFTYQAQESGLNFGFTYDNYIGEDAGSGHLKGFRLSFEQEKQQFRRSGSWRVGFKYSNGNFLKDYIAVKNYTLQNAALPKDIKVIGETNYKTLQFEITKKMYLLNRNIQYGGPYILAGIGFNITKYVTDYYTYDKTIYSLTNKKENNGDFHRQFTAFCGGGYDINLEVVSLFIESDFNIPYLTIHDEEIFEFEFRDSAYKFWSISIGLRFHLR